MPKLWLTLGIISLLFGVLIYLDQEIRLNASWNWDQFWHHEPLIGIAVCVGIALVIVAISEYVRKPHKRN